MRTTSEADAAAIERLIGAAAERGVIDATQRDALRALSDELALRSTDVPVYAPGEEALEAPRAFNAITVAYSAGALLVLFALGWFLADRWRELGAGGVLAVSLLYTGAFAITSAALRRRGFRVAGGLSATLAVAMTPVWTFALMRLAGEWPTTADWRDPLLSYPPWIESRRIVLELATIGVALATARRVRFFALGAPMAAGLVALLISLGQALGDPRLAWYVGPYYLCAVACLVLAIAYLIDRRQPAGEDYALWFYLAGVVLLLVGYVQVWSSIGAWRHALPLTAAALIAASLYLRRRTLLLAGGVAAFGYLGYLAFDVFRRVVALPVALAALGLLVIVATVWMQRRFPLLVARVGREDDRGNRTLPGGTIAALVPFAIAVTAMWFSVSEAKVRTAELDFRNRLYQRGAASRPRAPEPPERPAPAAPSARNRP